MEFLNANNEVGDHSEVDMGISMGDLRQAQNYIRELEAERDSWKERCENHEQGDIAWELDKVKGELADLKSSSFSRAAWESMNKQLSEISRENDELRAINETWAKFKSAPSVKGWVMTKPDGEVRELTFSLARSHTESKAVQTTETARRAEIRLIEDED